MTRHVKEMISIFLTKLGKLSNQSRNNVALNLIIPTSRIAVARLNEWGMSVPWLRISSVVEKVDAHDRQQRHTMPRSLGYHMPNL